MPPKKKNDGAVADRRGRHGAGPKLVKEFRRNFGQCGEVPRHRHGAFEPQIVGKHERRFTGFDDKIIALYARGLTVSEVQAHLQEMYAVDVSPDLISSDRRRHGRGNGVAELAARADVSGCVLRCAARQDPRGRGRAQRGHLPRAGRAA